MYVQKYTTVHMHTKIPDIFGRWYPVVIRCLCVCMHKCARAHTHTHGTDTTLDIYLQLNIV